MKKLIKVTASDIRRGKRVDGNACPVGLAIRRTFKARAKDVLVVSFAAWVGKRKYELPEEASRFIYRFDDGEKVEPFSFVLSV